MKKWLGGLLGCAAWLWAGCAFAQVDLSGNWVMEMNQDFQQRLEGPNPVDFLGIPLNAAGRASALSHSASKIAELHRQCEPYPAHYLLIGPFGFRMWPTRDSVTGAVIAWHVSSAIDRVPMTIWMDGRPHPSPQALHTSVGFTTGRWEGPTLVTTTTHLRDGQLTRNGAPNSNQETLTMFFSLHENLLSITAIVHDPVYLSEPYTISQSWSSDPNQMVLGTAKLGAVPIMICTPEEEVPGLSDGYHIATNVPGQNPDLQFMPNNYNIPLEAALGGPETMYPEFKRTLEGKYSPPTKACTMHCCGSSSISQSALRALNCPGSELRGGPPGGLPGGPPGAGAR